jgi:hypothetical protein
MPLSAVLPCGFCPPIVRMAFSENPINAQAEHCRESKCGGYHEQFCRCQRAKANSTCLYRDDRWSGYGYGPAPYYPAFLSRCRLQQRLFALRLREMRNGNRDQSAVPPPRDRARDALRFPEGQNVGLADGVLAPRTSPSRTNCTNFQRRGLNSREGGSRTYGVLQQVFRLRRVSLSDCFVWLNGPESNKRPTG